ncbi:hypothetical protein LX36DRAFT_303229 [Colletotrichum falcatum]|nr:hypothetical protein LX36DRAFT_303229 [Colletotrichum falcatum]
MQMSALGGRRKYPASVPPDQSTNKHVHPLPSRRRRPVSKSSGPHFPQPAPKSSLCLEEEGGKELNLSRLSRLKRHLTHVRSLTFVFHLPRYGFFFIIYFSFLFFLFPLDVPPPTFTPAVCLDPHPLWCRRT